MSRSHPAQDFIPASAMGHRRLLRRLGCFSAVFSAIFLLSLIVLLHGDNDRISKLKQIKSAQFNHDLPKKKVNKQNHTLRPERKLPTTLAQFRLRSEKIEKACRTRNYNLNWHPLSSSHIFYVKSLAFCALPKTGTTFWKRILFYVDKNFTGPLLSHTFGDVHNRTRYLLHRRSEDHQHVVFVREPYERLYSAYLNKIFNPRRGNWVKYAKPVLHFTRPRASKTERHCAHNVTFAEFVRYFIHTELAAGSPTTKKPGRDEHFVPVSQQCGFCSRHYDFIGRQETFAEDTMGILQHFNLSSMLQFSDFDLEYARYEMDALIRYAFEHEIDFITGLKGTKCLSSVEVLRRLWKGFQIKGSIGATDFFPLSGSPRIDKDTFLTASLMALNRSLINRKSVSQRRLFNDLTLTNKEESMLEAYSTVPLKDRKQLKRIFQNDFDFFGYEANHPLVFPVDDEFELPYYRYFDVFDSFLFPKAGDDTL